MSKRSPEWPVNTHSISLSMVELTDLGGRSITVAARIGWFRPRATLVDYTRNCETSRAGWDIALMNYETLFSVVGTLGIGAIVGAYAQARFQRQKDLSTDEHNLKRKRYGSILIQMLTVLDPESLPKLGEFRDDLKSLDDVQHELKTELLNAVLFANDEVVRCLAEFIRERSQRCYLKTATAMRKDLWGKSTKITEFDLAVLNEPLHK